MYISVPSPEGTNLPDEERYLKIFTTKMCQLPTSSPVILPLLEKLHFTAELADRSS